MSLPPPEPNPVDAALAAYVEQRIDERLGQMLTRIDWDAIDQRIEARIQAEREFLFSIIGEWQGELGAAIDSLGKAIVDVREQQRRKEIGQAEELKAQVDRMLEAMERLRLILEMRSKSSLVDLPALSTRRNVN
jgi:hypothetical protein